MFKEIINCVKRYFKGEDNLCHRIICANIMVYNKQVMGKRFKRIE